VCVCVCVVKFGSSVNMAEHVLCVCVRVCLCDCKQIKRECEKEESE
jgi:hypothetical protein